ncbi:TPA: ATP-binding protein [archaeon]|uniref:ATP-binding protein n=1 Tax=Candidatus Naiadarchaeum limnaeum TaxID=2756139 RepID=A0A832XM93_9ARCH|nr:ATP-binding protein [Candidatus Naiadarchaeum limnaeum]
MEFVEIGTVVSNTEGPTPSQFDFVVKDNGAKVRKGQFVELETDEGRLVGRIEDIFKANRYFERAESVREYEKNKDMSSIFPVDRWEFTVARAKPLGIMANPGTLKPSFPPSPGEKVFLASEDVLPKFLGLDENGINLGTIEHHDIEVKINLTKLLQKHLAILAMSGAGKSYFTSILIEELLERQKKYGRVGVVLIDVHGEYTSFAEPVKAGDKCIDYSKKCAHINGVNIRIGISNMSAEQLMYYMPNMSAIQRRELAKVFDSFKRKMKKGEGTFNLDDIIKEVEETDLIKKQATKESLIGWLYDANKDTIFSDTDYPNLRTLVKPGHLSIIDLSGILGSRRKQIIVSHLARELFNMRRNNQIPPFLLVIEEAHQFVPEGVKSEYALAKSIVEQVAREGRKFHASVCLISQRPKRLSTTVLSQCNTHIIMRVTNPYDLDHIKQSSEGITQSALDSISTLPVGEGLIVGEAVNHPIFVKIRKRKSQESTKGIDLEKAAQKFEEKMEARSKDAEAFFG